MTLVARLDASGARTLGAAFRLAVPNYWKRTRRKAGDPLFVEYTTMRDGRVRPEHRILHGRVFQVGTALHALYMPPLGFNCRCKYKPISRKRMAERKKRVTRSLVKYKGQVYIGDGDMKVDEAINALPELPRPRRRKALAALPPAQRILALRAALAVDGARLWSRIALRAAAAQDVRLVRERLIGPDAPLQWIEIAPEGEWHGYVDDDGEARSFSFSEASFGEMVANFNRRKNPIPLTWEHPDAGQRRPAAGWIHALRVKQDERGAVLEGLLEMGAQLAEDVRAGAYRYCSAVVTFSTPDLVTGKVTGARLHEVGATNTPAMDGMRPMALTLKERRMNEKKEAPVKLATVAESIEAGIELLGIDEGSELTGDAAGKLAEFLMGLANGASEPEPAADAEMTDGTAELAEGMDDEVEMAADVPEGVEASEPGTMMPSSPEELVQALQDATGMSFEDLAQSLPDIASMFGGGTEEVAPALAERVRKFVEARGRAAEVKMSEKDATIVALSRQVEDLRKREKERELRELTSAVDAAIGAGHYLPDDRDWLVQQAKEAPKMLSATLARGAKRPAVPTAPMQVADAKPSGGANGADDVQLSDAEVAYWKPRARRALGAAATAEQVDTQARKLAERHKRTGRPFTLSN